jgi:C4-dicarboxylate-specific signal transduction histidine kinase
VKTSTTTLFVSHSEMSTLTAATVAPAPGTHSASSSVATSERLGANARARAGSRSSLSASLRAREQSGELQLAQQAYDWLPWQRQIPPPPRVDLWRSVHAQIELRVAAHERAERAERELAVARAAKGTVLLLRSQVDELRAAAAQHTAALCAALDAAEQTRLGLVLEKDFCYTEIDRLEHEVAHRQRMVRQRFRPRFFFVFCFCLGHLSDLSVRRHASCRLKSRVSVRRRNSGITSNSAWRSCRFRSANWPTSCSRRALS